MKKLAVMICLCFVFVLTVPVIAADLSQIESGAKPIGLGRAYVGFAEDSNSMLTNPAGMAGISSIEVTSMYSNIMGDENFTLVSAAVPLSLGTIGIAYLGSNVSGFISATADANGRNQAGPMFDYGSSITALSFSRKMLKDVYLGMNFKYFNKSAGGLQGGTGTGMSADMGVIYKRSEDLNIGLSVQNLVSTGIKWDSGAEDEIPSVIMAGVMYKINGSLRAALEYDQDKVNGGLAKGGIEWELSRYLDLRGGFEQVPGGAMNFTAGLGLSAWSLKLDYAYYYDTTVSGNSTHYISMEIDLPRIDFLNESGGQNKNAAAKELGEASKDYAGGNVPDAVKKLRDVLKKEPDNQDAIKLIKKIGEDVNMTLNDLGTSETISEVSSVREMMAKVLNYFYIGEYGLAVESAKKVLLVMPDDKLALKRLGSSYYMLGDMDNALKAWEKASALDPGDEKLKGIVKYLEGQNKAKDKKKIYIPPVSSVITSPEGTKLPK